MKGLLLSLLVLMGTAHAAEVSIARASELRADRYVDAASLGTLAVGTKLEMLASDAGWVKVKAGDRTGWVRATSLGGDAATVSPLARLESGRSAQGNLVVAAGIRGIGAAKASRHALIVASADVDVVSARLIARRIAVPDANVDVADKAAVTRAFQRLADRIQPGDQAMVYLAGATCDVGGALQPVIAKAARVWVIVDGACASKAIVADANNLVLLRAAGDAPSTVTPDGGLLTQRLVDCVLGDAIDLDQSGSISVAELGACIDRRGRLASVTGQGAYSPFVAATPDVPRGTAAVDVAASARAAMADLLAQRDARIRVDLIADPASLAIGRDDLGLSLTSSHAGFVYLVLLGSDAKSFDLLFPNDLDRDNAIAAGQTLKLPRAQWAIRSAGPPGRDVLLALVSESPRDLSALTRRDGPFAASLADLDGRAMLQWVLARSAASGSDDCVTGGQRRNLSVVRVCSDAFGAALVEVEERP